MRHALILGAILATVALPAFAQDAMAPMGMMSPPNMASAMSADGHMGSMAVTDPAMETKMMGMATPVAACTMMMTDKDGKMFMVDTSSADAKAACEKLAMTAPMAPAANSMASDAMKPMSMMPAGMTMAMMPDGHMGSMPNDPAMADKMMGMAAPVTGCMMTMSDKDGKMYVVDTSSADAKAECDKLSMMAPPAM